MEKLNEDLNTAGINTPAANEEDIETAKKTAIKTMLGTEDLDLDNLEDDELDQLLGKAHQTLTEKIEDIVEDMSLLGSSDFDIQEALRVHAGLKMSEAKEILEDMKLNG